MKSTEKLSYLKEAATRCVGKESRNYAVTPIIFVCTHNRRDGGEVVRLWELLGEVCRNYHVSAWTWFLTNRRKQKMHSKSHTHIRDLGNHIDVTEHSSFRNILVLQSPESPEQRSRVECRVFGNLQQSRTNVRHHTRTNDLSQLTHASIPKFLDSAQN